MLNGDFTDAALVLVGHGSTLNGDSSAPVDQHVQALRDSGKFGEVEACFWKLEPAISSVRHQVFSRRVFVVPLFISEGYFTQQVIPREIGFCSNTDKSFRRVCDWDGQRWYYCDPVGTHMSMTEALANRATEVLDQNPFPARPADDQVSLFIAGHGTGNNQNSRRIIEEQAEALKGSRRYADVHAVFMEEDPRIEDCYELATCRNIVMVPFFISDGLHSFEDIPVMLGESETTVSKRLKEGVPTWRNPTEKKDKRVWYTRSIGLDPRMTDVILERVGEASQWSSDEMVTL